MCLLVSGNGWLRIENTEIGGRVQSHYDFEIAKNEIKTPRFLPYDDDKAIQRKIMWAGIIDTWIAENGLADIPIKEGQKCLICGDDLGGRVSSAKYCFGCARKKQYYDRKT
jgi:hypothetical protein